MGLVLQIDIGPSATTIVAMDMEVPVRHVVFTSCRRTNQLARLVHLAFRYWINGYLHGLGLRLDLFRLGPFFWSLNAIKTQKICPLCLPISYVLALPT